MPLTTVYQPSVAEVGEWASELEALHARIAARFERAEPRRRALAGTVRPCAARWMIRARRTKRTGALWARMSRAILIRSSSVNARRCSCSAMSVASCRNGLHDLDHT